MLLLYVETELGLKITIGLSIIKKIYISFYNYVLRYGIINWGKASAYLLNPLIVLQKPAIRNLAGIRVGGGTVVWFKKLEVLNLEKLYKYSAACYVHKHKGKFNIQLRSRVV